MSTEFSVSFYLYILCGVSLRLISDLTDVFVSVLLPDGLSLEGLISESSTRLLVALLEFPLQFI